MKKRIRYNGKIYEVSEEKVANFLFKYNGAELLDSEPLKKKNNQPMYQAMVLQVLPNPSQHQNLHI